jgi:hypothetical protein
MIVKGHVNTQTVRKGRIWTLQKKNLREDGPSISKHDSLLQAGELVLALLTTLESSRSVFHSRYSQGFFLRHNIQIGSEEHVGLTPVQRQPFTHSSGANLSGRKAVRSSTRISIAGVKTAVRPTLSRHKSSAV